MVLVTLSNLDNSKARAGRASRLQKLDGIVYFLDVDKNFVLKGR